MPGSASLIEAGIIDSTGVLELVGFLEETYEIQIAEAELVPENLDSIDNIVGFVGAKRNGSAAPEPRGSSRRLRLDARGAWTSTASVRPLRSSTP